MEIIEDNIQLSHDQAILKSKLTPLRRVVIFLNDVLLPENIGSCIRTTEALGETHLYCSKKTYEIFKEKKNKIYSIARTDKIDIKLCDIASLCVDNNIVCLEITKESIPVFDCTPHNGLVVLVVGSERHGINENILKKYRDHVHIPMNGHNSSMNVASSAAIAAYILAFK